LDSSRAPLFLHCFARLLPSTGVIIEKRDGEIMGVDIRKVGEENRRWGKKGEKKGGGREGGEEEKRIREEIEGEDTIASKKLPNHIFQDTLMNLRHISNRLHAIHPSHPLLTHPSRW
jgi:hypothetical protein